MPFRNQFTEFLYAAFFAPFLRQGAAQSTHYSVKLAADFDGTLAGRRDDRIQADAVVVEWEKQAGCALKARTLQMERYVAEQASRPLAFGWQAQFEAQIHALRGEALLVCGHAGWRRHFTARLGWSATIHQASAARFDSRLQFLSGR